MVEVIKKRIINVNVLGGIFWRLILVDKMKCRAELEETKISNVVSKGVLRFFFDHSFLMV